jgi:hypothetical protein
MGYITYEVATTPGQAVSTLKPMPGKSIDNKRFSVALNPNGTIQSIHDNSLNRQLVNNEGERPFNDLLRVEGVDASKVSYPVAPKIRVRNGLQMSEILVERERSSFPLTRIVIYNYLDRIEIRNELDPDRMPFVGGIIIGTIRITLLFRSMFLRTI